LLLPQKPNYGIDAPKVVLGLFLAGILGLATGLASMAMGSRPGRWTGWIAGPSLWMGGTFLLESAVMWWGSRIGKLRFRDKIIQAIPWRGDEQVLDVGCGHGLMLIGAAKRLRGGKAIGIDLWQKEDQAGNSRAATLRNVESENVTEVVELRDGDARKLPFAGAAFDIVLSSWALHNIYDRSQRDQAVREIIRVLKPGGCATIIDIRHAREYAQIFRENRMVGVKLAGPNFLFVIPTLTLTATKPLPPSTHE